MRNARNLAGEIDLWKLAWQQIETFVDRIEGAKDQDAASLRKLDALLRAARAVEHQRVLRNETVPLSDPVIDQLPTGLSATDAWSVEYRKWRLPGLDECELAAANLLMDSGNEDNPLTDTIRLPPLTDLFQIRVEESDPRFAGSADGLVTLQVPSYPGAEAGSPINGSSIAFAVPVEEEDPVNSGGGEAATASAFPRVRRKMATLDEIDHDDAVLAWPVLCTNRRALATATPAEVQFVGPAGEIAWKASYDPEARHIIAHVRANTVPTVPVTRLSEIQQAASAAAATVSDDASDLRTAAEVIEEEGASASDLPGQLSAAADTLGAAPAAFAGLASAAGALLALVLSPPLGVLVTAAQMSQRLALADLLEQRLNALPGVLATPTLFSQRVEDGVLATDLGDAMRARLAYPDGTLRIVRALELALQATWPVRVRWFRARHKFFLSPLFARFRAPFLAGLAALIKGGDTGLPVEGLSVAVQAPVGGETLATAQPASLLPALAPIEAGHVGILAAERPVAAIVLGVQAGAQSVELKVSPLRVSVASEPEVPGSPGIIAGNQPVLTETDGLSETELRRGEPDEGPAGEGLVQETVALWSKLSLLFGWLSVEQSLRNDTTLTAGAFSNRLLPDPSSAPLRNLALHGEVPPLATSLVIQGAPNAYWDRDFLPPEPLVARPGEIILLRGRAEPKEGQAQGPMVQAAVEVEMAFRTTGAMLARVDTSQSGKLATTPPPQDETGACMLVCGPEEDIIMIVLRRSWQRSRLVSDITLRRDFSGFDLPNLATGKLLPVDFVEQVLDPDAPISDNGIDRHDEFRAAVDVFSAWMQYARQ